MSSRYLSLPAYAELCCLSNFSFLSGASQPEELIERAKALRYEALAITDECSLAGVVRAHVEAKKLGFKLLIGTQMCLSPQLGARPDLQFDDEEDQLLLAAAAEIRSAPALAMHVVFLAQNNQGYRNLSMWITMARRRAAKGNYVAYPSDVEGRAANGNMLSGMAGCHAILVLNDQAVSLPELVSQAQWLKNWMPERCSLGVVLHRHANDKNVLKLANKVAATTGLQAVPLGDVRMHVRSRKALLDVLTATRFKCTVAECGHMLMRNADAHLRSRLRLGLTYPAEWMARSVAIAASCEFTLDSLKYQYPREVVEKGHTPASWLRHLVETGAQDRFPDSFEYDKYKPQWEEELALIAILDFEAYFLTVADIVRWARSQGILCQGRGSAANSLVCFCLRVTEVDPRRATLLFGRFISAERNEPPDIDIDFEHQRREEVIQYIYGKYGRRRAALTGVVISYRPRSALRDVGRALGMDVDRITGVARGQHWFDGRRIDPQRLRDNGIDPDAPTSKLWIELTRQLIGFPRHLSQHPGGFLIARDHIEEFVPVENAAMDGRTVIQWDKDDLDALRLIKVDVLALGMLSAVRRANEFVSSKLGHDFDLALLMKQADDKRTYDMLCKADSVGVFQVESRAQMTMLPRLRPECYYDLVIEVAIVRPGPIQGGMVHPYLRRRGKQEVIDIPSPELAPALERTKGVPIFQEQVMQIAMIAGDFSAGEADELRRSMAAWKRKGNLEQVSDKLVERMVAKGYAREFAERIRDQIKGFGEYGFPESHAASFALLVYASAWIKRHHPDAFLAALLNSQPMGFYQPAQLVRDAREHGVQVLPAHLQHSQWNSTLEGGDQFVRGADEQPLRAVRLGFDRINGLQRPAAERIVAARDERPFDTTEDLARRAQLDAHTLGLLARADALLGLTGHRHQAAWAVAGVDTRATALLRQTRTHEAETAALPLPDIGSTVLADYRATGLSLVQHPLALLRPQLVAFKVQTASVLKHYPSGRLARASGIVTHRQRPETAKGVIFVTLEDETGHVNVIVWPQLVDAQRKPLLSATLLTVYGVWQCEGEVRHLVARRLVDHSALLQGLSPKSRDFH